MDANICTLRYMSSLILSFVLSIQEFWEFGGSWDLFMLGMHTLCKGGCGNTVAGPLGRYVGASASCHTWWSLVWSRSGCKSLKKVIVGMYNTVSVMKLMVNT